MQSSTGRRVAIVQPWIPQYRSVFFERLREVLNEADVELDVFYGDPLGAVGARKDASSPPSAVHLPTRCITLLRRELRVKSLLPMYRRGPYDLVILEQAVGNLESYSLLFKRNSRTRLAFWGHGRTFTKPISSKQYALMQWLTLRGDWFFSYTEGGVKAVNEYGFPEERTTVLNNAIDASELRSQIDAVETREMLAFQQANDLRGKTALFIGGLDEAKRIPFLLEACKKAHEQEPDFRLLVAGAGVDEPLVSAAASENTWVSYLGNLRGPAKAIAFASSEILAMPGRVGLVAVDSFAGGVPIVTTDWPWHAPEHEYLIHDDNSLTAADTVGTYASTLLMALEPTNRERLVEGCDRAAGKYTMHAMVDNFRDGVLSALAGSRGSGRSWIANDC